MKHAKFLPVLALLILAGLTLTQLRMSNSLAAGKGNSPLDEKHWSLYALPYFDSDYSRRPIVVRSVTMDASRGLAITKVGIFNRSKAIKAVKLKWYLSDDKNKGVVILQGETPSIKIDKGLPARASLELEQEIVSFEKILDKVKDHAALGAQFHLDVSVSSVEYADGAKWEEQAKARLDYMEFPKQARSRESLLDYIGLPKEDWSNDNFSLKVGYVKSAPAPAPQSCIPTYTACVYHSCGGYGCYWADCSNSIPAPSMCQSDPYGTWCTTTYCG